MINKRNDKNIASEFVRSCECVFVHVYVFVRVYVYVYVCVCISLCTRVYILVGVCMHGCIFFARVCM